MDSLDEIRKKKLEALQGQQSQEAQEQQQMQQQLAQLEQMVKHVFTKEALERFGNIKAAYPEKAQQLILVLAQAVQSGQVETINDEMLKEILKKLQPEKKDIKIRRV